MSNVSRVVSAAVVGLAAFVVAASLNPGTAVSHEGAPAPREPAWVDPAPSGRLADGRSFGPAPRDGERMPDLVAVYTDDGVEGYADSALVFGSPDDAPASPQEAVRIQLVNEAKARATGRPVTKDIPVYSSTGRTIGTFSITLADVP